MSFTIEKMIKAENVLKNDKVWSDLMEKISHLNFEWKKRLTDIQALDLEKRENELLDKIFKRENELGIKYFNGFMFYKGAL